MLAVLIAFWYSVKFPEKGKDNSNRRFKEDKFQSLLKEREEEAEARQRKLQKKEGGKEEEEEEEEKKGENKCRARAG